LICCNAKKDDFSEFRQKFYADSLFQTDHIIFPLKGINSDRMEIDDTIYIWQNKEDWIYHTDPNDDKEIITDIIIKNDTVVEELSHLDYGGFWHLVRFEKTNNEWYLTRFEFVF
jgi:hypothetical protein